MIRAVICFGHLYADAPIELRRAPRFGLHVEGEAYAVGRNAGDR